MAGKKGSRPRGATSPEERRQIKNATARGTYSANREKRSQQAKQRRLADPERFRRQAMKYYRSNRTERMRSNRACAIRAKTARPWAEILYAARSRAKTKGLPFNLDWEWCVSRWTGQCELSGLPFNLNRKRGEKRTYSPSIDRIIPDLGYVKGNCRFILTSLNTFKSDGTDAEMYAVALAFVLHQDALKLASATPT